MRKRLSVVVPMPAGRARRLITKGALDNVLGDVHAACKRRMEPSPLDAASTGSDIEQRYSEWSEQGFRVLGVATKTADAQARILFARR